MRVLSLFSGIGAFDLGLARAGMRTVAFCECDAFCRRVLARHWPGVPCYDDVRTITGKRLAADGIAVDVICGGFPCQDISVAGSGAGITGERSGLWTEFARIIGEVGPRYVLVENVSALLHRGLAEVLGDLAALGYDAEWHCIPASAIGAPHIRDRIWIIAYPDADIGGGQRVAEHAGEQSTSRHQPDGLGARGWRHGTVLADAHSGNGHGGSGTVQMGRLKITRQIADYGDTGRTQWGTEPDVGRVAHGVANRVDRLRSLGNALVPQIPELLGRAIMANSSKHPF